MGKLKRKQENNKISKQGLKIKCLFMNDHDTILFSFKYLNVSDVYKFIYITSSCFIVPSSIVITLSA